MSGQSDLQSLLAKLNSRSPVSTSANAQSGRPLTQPSFDPAAFFQSQASPPPVSPSTIEAPGLSRANMASATRSGGPASGSERTQSLLGLLNFGQHSPANFTAPMQQPGPIAQSISEDHSVRQENLHAKWVTPSDLTSSLLGPQSTRGDRGGGNVLSNAPLPSSSSTEVKTTPRTGSTAPESSQDALLKLLNRSVSSSSQQKAADNYKESGPAFILYGQPHADVPSTKQEDRPATFGNEDSSTRNASPIRMFGSSESREATPFEPPPPTAVEETKPLFTYSNPFEALIASRKATPQLPRSREASPAIGSLPQNLPSNGDKRKSNEGAPEPTSTRRKLTPKVPLRSGSSAEPTIKKKTSSEDLDATRGQASKKAKKVSKEVGVEGEGRASNNEIDAVVDKFEKTTMHEAANVETGLVNGDDTGPHEGHLINPTAGEEEDRNDDTAAAAPIARCETPKATPEPTPRVVPVYNFPLKPFISITIKDLPPSKVGLSEDGVMEISRFKKEFEQLDRTLASASSKYIIYAFVKNGGIRVIRQDDGSDRQVFKNSGDRIFHLNLCTTALTAPPTDQQGVLGIGFSGAVYYATIARDGNDLFDNDSMDTESLVFPAYAPGDENSTGDSLKTRVRRSSRHPEFFAIGRGKSIHLVWPATVLSTKYGVNGQDRIVDIEKLYNDRPLMITTGKVAKDFIFSEDDTLIASLDNAGRLKFWDIRNLVNESNATASKVQAEDVVVPLLTFAVASPAEKSWPTSVLFVDKLRPYTKGTALRYILVGLKQNHTLQLWDIALGKAVQELNFPHDTQTGGICSVSYHPNSGIIVVGHPGRNSIFFLHLSAPRYPLPSMSQATHLERIATKDPELPKPEATACISGMREMSFASKGHLRSLDLLPVHKAADASKESLDSQILFELYAVHSKGVTCLAIRKEDLGWGPDGKVLHAADDPVEIGVVELGELKRPVSADEADVTGVAETSRPTKPTKKKTSKSATEPPAEPASIKEKVGQSSLTPAANTEADLQNEVKGGVNTLPVETLPEKDKKKKKKPGPGNILAPTSTKGLDPTKPISQPPSPSKTPATPANLGNQAPTPDISATMATGQVPRSSVIPTSSGAAKGHVGVDLSSDRLEQEIKKIEASVSTEFGKQFDKLYRRLDDERHVLDAAGTSRQEAVLRLVSSSLSTNVEQTLNRIIGQHIQQAVLPAVTNVTGQAIHAQVGEALARSLQTVVTHEIGTQLPGIVSTALQNPTHLSSLTENIAKRLNPTMEAHFTELMRLTISPAFQRLAVSAAEKATGEIEGRIAAKLRQYEGDRQHDAAKIDRLQASIQQLMEMISHLSDGQIAFQAQILKDRSSLAQLAEASSRPPSSAATALRSTPLPSRQLPSAQPSPIAPPPKKRSPEELEFEEIGNLMDVGKFEEASIKWLQSRQTVDLFDKLFVNYTPDYLQSAVSPLVAFSVGITVANSFEQNVHARLDWIYAALSTVDTRDPELVSLSQHGPALLSSLISKLEQLYGANLGRGRGDPMMQLIPQIITKAKEVNAQFKVSG